MHEKREGFTHATPRRCLVSLLTAVDCQNAYLGVCDAFYGCDFPGICVDFGGGNAQCQPS
jgi:hypothetical protein